MRARPVSRVALLSGALVLALLAALVATAMTGPVPAPEQHPDTPRTLSSSTSTLTLPDGSRHTLQVPSGLQVSLFATGVPTARFMALGPRGVIFVGSTGGTVSAVLPGASARRAARVVNAAARARRPARRGLPQRAAVRG